MLTSSISTKTLRAKATRLGWRTRFYRNWNRLHGNDGFIVFNASRNYPVCANVLDEGELRELLIDKIDSEEWAS